jgi:hypothetical protein
MVDRALLEMTMPPVLGKGDRGERCEPGPDPTRPLAFVLRERIKGELLLLQAAKNGNTEQVSSQGRKKRTSF